MGKRILLAVVLSFMVSMLWSSFVSRTYHIENKTVTIQNTTKNYLTQEAIVANYHVSGEEIPKTITPPLNFPFGNTEIVFDVKTASIREIIFNNYKKYPFQIKNGFWLADNELNFTAEHIGQNEISFKHQDAEKIINKRFIFTNSLYNIRLELSIENLSNRRLDFNPALVLGALNFGSNSIQERFQEAILATKDKILRVNGKKSVDAIEVSFLGLRDRYFCAVMTTENRDFSGFVDKINTKESLVGLKFPVLQLLPGQLFVGKFNAYFGPQDLNLISSVKPEWASIIHFGVFDIISQILLKLLEAIFKLVHNWGWAIVIISFLIYLVLFPLTLKQMHSMKKMQSLQPQLEELKRKHKDNPKRLNQEIMELYKSSKVNPFGGCLPLLLQLPIFFALYQTLMRSIALKGAEFLWIRDLSEPDKFSVAGKEFNLLPILMIIIMFFQQKLSQAASSPETAEQQKMMMIIFPLLFGFLFYNMPSGLVLYWLLNSAFMLISQLSILKSVKTNE
ncbi:MAG: membrane protein insertase YidC [Candidatus Omnitrophota bacterium]|nr:MAG: membrane protein insertase YidC [Candidatus Omnitrophota bacterium]